jgi:hypothetical protein
MQATWNQALSALRMKGTDTGAQASETVNDLIGQAQTLMRDSRASGMRAAQAMMDSYAAMVSGVLIGMSEGLKAGGAKPGGGNAPAAAAPAKAAAAAGADGGSAAAAAPAAAPRRSRPARKRS